MNIKWKENKVADALSRRVHLLHEISLSKMEDILKTEIRSTLENDPFYIEIKNKLL